MFLRTYGLTFCPWLKSKPHHRDEIQHY